ncbi:MAG: hypothetical protein CL868_20275 [Cytophagaceae bacterium]|nr:hypothetical protein [Cytophagaceae bacterium]|tara:strand:+ start:4561 stop:4980 length:420 start_codon:yes stop_codon:yes gene_type:complete
MKKGILVLMLIALSCTEKDPASMIPHLTGYWEIEEVVKPGGERIQFEINETIDYIKIDDSTGFRAKLKPQFDGSFKTNENKENLKVEVKEDSLKLLYSTPYNKWTETVLYADENKLEVLNNRNIKYVYKKYIPLNNPTK